MIEPNADEGIDHDDRDGTETKNIEIGKGPVTEVNDTMHSDGQEFSKREEEGELLPAGSEDDQNELEKQVAETEVCKALRELDAKIDDLKNQQDQYLALQERLQELRQDQIATLLSPSVKKQILLLKQMEDAAERVYETLEPADIVAKQRQDFRYFAEVLMDALEQMGFHKISATQADVFNARLHKVVNKVDTTDSKLDKKIAKELAPGFKYTGSSRATFPASVSVFKLINEQPESENQQEK